MLSNLNVDDLPQTGLQVKLCISFRQELSLREFPLTNKQKTWSKTLHAKTGVKYRMLSLNTESLPQ